VNFLIRIGDTILALLAVLTLLILLTLTNDILKR